MLHNQDTTDEYQPLPSANIILITDWPMQARSIISAGTDVGPVYL